MSYTTHHTDRPGAAAACGAERTPGYAATTDTSYVDCRRCLARLELREKLAEATACLGRAEADPEAASYWTRRAELLAAQANDAAERSGMTVRDHACGWCTPDRPCPPPAAAERLRLDSSGPLLQLRHRPGCPAVRTPDVCCAEVDA